MGDNDATIQLVCAVVFENLELLEPGFLIRVQQDDALSQIFGVMKEVVPTLKHQDESSFSLCKPILEIPASVPDPLTPQHLGEPLSKFSLVNSHFSPSAISSDPPLNVVICFRDRDHRVYRRIDLQPFQGGQVRNDLFTLVSIRLPVAGDINRPQADYLATNDISQSDTMAPDFVLDFEKELIQPRYIEEGVLNNSFLPIVRQHLGERGFQRYFTTSANGTETSQVTTLESIHYSIAFADKHTLDHIAYSSNQEAHVYNLLGRLTAAPSVSIHGTKPQFNTLWPFKLVVENSARFRRSQEDSTGIERYQYTPCSDFSITVNGFPLLLLEVVSDLANPNQPNGMDLHRMLLQASCLVRLGNSQLKSKDKTSHFVVKAIYINKHYHAFEYTLFQRSALDQVNYTEKVTILTDPMGVFQFIFRLYNFIRLAEDVYAKLSPDLPLVLASLNIDIATYPSATSQKRGGPGDGAGGSPKRRTPNTNTGHASGTSLQDANVLAVIRRKRYTILPDDGRLKLTTRKAVSNMGREVALKLLDGTTDEARILLELQGHRTRTNHTISLLDNFDVIISGHTTGTVIVTPWQTPLNGYVARPDFPRMVESLQIQFLEGVSLLHEHGIAHLDLKPENIVVDERRSPSWLSIIDFGLSVFVASEETKIEGYRGTPSWAAPEVGTENGPAKEYSPILADRWSCGQVLTYFTKFLQADDTSALAFRSIRRQLLELSPRKRPPLSTLLESLQGICGKKRSGDAVLSQKRPRLD